MEAQQDELFHEDFRDALRHCIAALGGPKRVGAELWPSVSIDQARSRLNNCLDANRAEKFDLEEVIWILKAARQHQVHSALAHLLADCGYAPPQAIEPEDEAASLMRAFNQSVKVQRGILNRLENLNLPTIKAVS